MKLKYYISKNLIKFTLIAFIIFTAIIQLAYGYSLDSSNANPRIIFKCQPSTISANLSGAIVSVTVLINSSQAVMWNGSFTSSKESYSMIDNGGGYWTYTYGNNASLLYGNKTITFLVSDALTGTWQNETNTWIYVTSDVCTGTGLTNYTQLNSGLGNYTSKLWTNPDYTIINLALQPWLDYWGYFFYVLIIGVVMTSVYKKSQNIWQPLLVAFVSLGALAGTTPIPPQFRNYVVLILGVAIGAIFYRLALRGR